MFGSVGNDTAQTGAEPELNDVCVAYGKRGLHQYPVLLDENGEMFPENTMAAFDFWEEHQAAMLPASRTPTSSNNTPSSKSTYRGKCVLHIRFIVHTYHAQSMYIVLT